MKKITIDLEKEFIEFDTGENVPFSRLEDFRVQKDRDGEIRVNITSRKALI